MKVNPENTDELLNSFIDAELSARQMTEVQRLLKNDTEVAHRLGQLRKCRTFLGSLPTHQAPTGIVDRVKASIRPKYVIPQHFSKEQKRKGARHLFLRKIVTAAAMFTLIAVLASVVYTIVAPQPGTEKPLVSNDEPAGQVPLSQAAVAMLQLELTTPGFAEMDAAFQKTLQARSQIQLLRSDRQANTSQYVLSGSRDSLESVLTAFGETWEKLDSAALVVHGQTAKEPVRINAVTLEQVIEIARLDTFDRQLRAASYYAAKNEAAIRSSDPTGRSGTAVATSNAGMPTIPRPVLTSDQNSTEPTRNNNSGENVELAIVITGVSG